MASIRVSCLVPKCPNDAVDRGRCLVHRQTTSQRGYGIDHQRDRAAHLHGARCEACGCTRNLQRDHRLPVSMGGTEAPGNKRWLCRCPEHGCHDRLGVRWDRVRGRGRDGLRPPRTLTQPHDRERYS